MWWSNWTFRFLITKFRAPESLKYTLYFSYFSIKHLLMVTVRNQRQTRLPCVSTLCLHLEADIESWNMLFFFFFKQNKNKNKNIYSPVTDCLTVLWSIDRRMQCSVSFHSIILLQMKNQRTFLILVKKTICFIFSQKKKKRFESQKAAQTLQCHSWLLLGQYISVQFPFLGHCMNWQSSLKGQP